MKYSVKIFQLDTLSELLSHIKYSDATFRHEYSEFALEIDNIATLIEKAKPKDSKRLENYTKSLISNYQAQLNGIISKIRKIKDDIINQTL